MSAVARIDLAAFEHNVASIVSAVAPAAAWVAVKSNAYGHGMLELADNALTAGASGLAVLDVPAALALRSHGITAPLFAWLHGTHTDFTSAVEHNIDLGVSTIEQLESIARVPGTARVHLKIDTGLHRNGIPDELWDSVCAAARGWEETNDIRVVGVWTHLADASLDADNAALDRFDAAIERARAAGLSPELLHAAASPTAIRNPRARYDVVRVGIATYGISPFDDVDGVGLGLRPVMSLHAEISSSTESQSIVSAGWTDGVPQSTDPGTFIAVGNNRASVLGVFPGHTVIDGSFPVGTIVDIVGGNGATAEDWAGWVDGIGDEIVTGIPTRVRRIYSR